MKNEGIDLIHAYRCDGFVCLGQLFSEQEMLKVNAAFQELERNPIDGIGLIYEMNSSTIRSIMGWQRSTGLLDAFARDYRVLEKVQQILGSDIEFHQTKYNPKSPGIFGGEKWDPHRGDAFWCLKDGVPDPDKLLSVFVATTDQTEENGAVCAWKGSHVVTLDELKPYIEGLDGEKGVEQDTAAYLSLQINEEMLRYFNQEFERVLFSGVIGTVWILNAGLLHSSTINRSKETRRLVANVFRTTDNRPAHPRSVAYLAEPANGPLVRKI